MTKSNHYTDRTCRPRCRPWPWFNTVGLHKIDSIHIDVNAGTVRHSRPTDKPNYAYGHGVLRGRSATAELLIKYKLVCYWLVYRDLKFFGQHGGRLLVYHPHWRKVSAGPFAGCPIPMQFGRLMQHSMSITVIWLLHFCRPYTRRSIRGGAILLPVLEWVTSLFSKGQKVICKANFDEISQSMAEIYCFVNIVIHKSIYTYNYFRFGKTNVRHIGILVFISTISP